MTPTLIVLTRSHRPFRRIRRVEIDGQRFDTVRDVTVRDNAEGLTEVTVTFVADVEYLDES